MYSGVVYCSPSLPRAVRLLVTQRLKVKSGLKKAR